MPLAANPEYELALRIGEALADEVDCWEPREIPFAGAELLLTINGRDYRLTVETKASLPDE